MLANSLGGIGMNLEIGTFLRGVEDSGIDSLTEGLVDRLEYYISQCDEHLEEDPLVEDAVYDKLVSILEKVRPDSAKLSTVWSKDSDLELDEDLNKFLFEYPMRSIRTVKSLVSSEVSWFTAGLPEVFDLHLALKENGHGVRVVYNCGYLELATSRGRSTAGRDITRHLRVLLGETCDKLIDYEITELRAEVVLPYSNLERAREFNPSIKNSFTSVSSLLRESATDEEIGLLKVIVYGVYSDALTFKTEGDMYSFLADDVGLEIPMDWVIPNVFRSDLVGELTNALRDIEEACIDYDYFTDGVVVSVDDCELFKELGDFNGKYRLGNMALKVGKWEQSLYSSEILEIRWMRGKTKKIPVAIVEPTLTASGSSVSKVPLYGPNYMLMLEAYTGNIIHFRYGGEAGVVPTTPDGRILTKGYIQNQVDDDYAEYSDYL